MTTEFVICVPLPNLEIYYTDHKADWGRKPENLFKFSPDDAYSLAGDKTPGEVYQLGAYHLSKEEEPGEEYKFFVHLTEGQSFPEIRDAIERAGYRVTGSGSPDPETSQRRMWFYDPRKPTRGEGVWINNVWPSYHGGR